MYFLWRTDTENLRGVDRTHEGRCSVDFSALPEIRLFTGWEGEHCDYDQTPRVIATTAPIALPPSISIALLRAIRSQDGPPEIHY